MHKNNVRNKKTVNYNNLETQFENKVHARIQNTKYSRRQKNTSIITSSNHIRMITVRKLKAYRTKVLHGQIGF